MFNIESGYLKSALSGAVLASVAVAAPALAQDFPPFPEPVIGPFPNTQGMKLEAQMVPASIGAVTPRSGVLLNDVWGWTSPNDEEYALVGTGDGMSVVRVTDPENPVFIGQVPATQTDDFANLWGDVGVYNVRRDDDDDYDDDEYGDDDYDDDDYTGYAYFTTEADGTGIVILELNQLDAMGPAPDPSYDIPASAIFKEGGYDSAHNVYVNSKTGFAYVVGVGLAGDTTACDDAPYHPSRFNTMILDLKADPLHPQIVACMADFGEHDIYVVNYNGPDKEHKGKEIAFVFDGRDKDAPSRRGLRTDDTPGEIIGGTTEIWDVTDKNDIKVLSSFTIPGICFSHAGWTSSNKHEFLLVNDELDELRDAEPNDGTGFFRTNFCASDAEPIVPDPGMLVVNVRDLDNPVFQERFTISSPGDNDHNSVRKGNKMYWAVYTAGTSVLKMKKKKGMLQLEEIGRMDTEPRQVPAFNGQWGIYPFKDSDTIVASDIVNGLMIMSLSDDDEEDDDDSKMSIAASSATSTAAGTSARATATGASANTFSATSLSADDANAQRLNYIKSRIIY